MSILQTAIAQNRDKFLVELSELSGKQLCDVFITLVKESGDADQGVTAGELLERLPQELLNEVLKYLDDDFTIQMQEPGKRALLGTNPLQESKRVQSESKTKRKPSAKTKGSNY